MSVAATMAFALAERVERSAGPRAGLVVYRPLTTSGDGEVRAKAILAALRCALALGDRAALTALTELWPTAHRGVWDAQVASLCKEMARLGAPFLSHAEALARAEVVRHRGARALYLHARCLDVGGDAQAARAFGDAIERAEKEGREDIALASRVRRAVLLSRSWTTLEAAIAEARRVELSRVSPGVRLELSRILLSSSSRFVRASAIGVLDELVRGDDAGLSSRALLEAASFADDVGEAVTPLELDRIRALFGRPAVVQARPAVKEIVDARAAIARRAPDLESALTVASTHDPTLAPLTRRARDIASGRIVAARPPEGVPHDASAADAWAGRQAEILEVALAMRDRALPRASLLLSALADAEARGEPLPAGILNVAMTALAFDDTELRDAAARFFAARLRRPRPGAPPGGYLVLADRLTAAGKEELAELARHAAVVVNEAGAVELVGALRARRGWELARSGDRAGAVVALREAKALLEPKKPGA